MPDKLESCVQHLIDKGTEESSAWAICKTSLGMIEKDEGEGEYLKRAEEMAEKAKTKKYALAVVDIPGVEVFAAGTWNGDTYGTDALDALVEAYNSTKDALTPFLKLSHDDSQRLAKKSGLAIAELPALGIVENLRRVGSKLVADFKNVPRKIAELMKVGAYRTRSAEIYKGVEVAGKKWKYLLKAVGLLGAEAPAVESLNNLDDIIALYSADKALQAARAYGRESEVRVYTFDQSALKEDAQAMEKLAELEKKYAEAQAKIAELTSDIDARKTQDYDGLKRSYDAQSKELSEIKMKFSQAEASVEDQDKKLKTAEARIKELNGDLAKHLADKQEAEDRSLVDKLISEKKISPAQKDVALVLLSSLEMTPEKKFKIGDKEFASTRGLVLEFLQRGSGVTLPTSFVTGTGGTPSRKGDEIGLDMDDKAKKYAEKNKVGYRAALLAVSRGEE